MGAASSSLLLPGTSLGLPFPASAWPLLLLCSSGGLRRIIYAFGYGYGLCMITGGALTWTESPPSTWASCACGLYAAYGMRLVAFLRRRQSSDTYNNSNHGKEMNSKMDSTPMPAKCFVTVFVSLTQLATTYALQPVVQANEFPVAGWAGLAAGAGGLLLETIADEQKLAAKQKDPNSPVMSGLYSIMRHPNYLGEILFWLGVFGGAQASIPLSGSWLQRFKGSFGPLMMVWVMIGAAGRLDEEAISKKYADNATYKQYFSATGSLLPKLF